MELVGDARITTVHINLSVLVVCADLHLTHAFTDARIEAVTIAVAIVRLNDHNLNMRDKEKEIAIAG